MPTTAARTDRLGFLERILKPQIAEAVRQAAHDRAANRRNAVQARAVELAEIEAQLPEVEATFAKAGAAVDDAIRRRRAADARLAEAMQARNDLYAARDRTVRRYDVLLADLGETRIANTLVFLRWLQRAAAHQAESHALAAAVKRSPWVAKYAPPWPAAETAQACEDAIARIEALQLSEVAPDEIDRLCAEAIAHVESVAGEDFMRRVEGVRTQFEAA